MDLNLHGHLAVVTGVSRGIGLVGTRTLLGEGVRVNTVSPGPLQTLWTAPGGVADILAERMDTDRDEVLDSAAPGFMQLSTGRMIEPQEVADQIVLLASPRSGSTTGAEVFIDGGMLKGLHCVGPGEPNRSARMLYRYDD